MTPLQLNLINQALRAAKQSGRATEVVQTPDGPTWAYEDRQLSRRPDTRRIWTSHLVVNLLPLAQFAQARHGDILWDDAEDAYWQAWMTDGEMTRQALPVVSVMRPTISGAVLHGPDADTLLNHQEAANELKNRTFFIAATARELLFILLSRAQPAAHLAQEPHSSGAA